MAWTTPRTWVASEVVTAALLNTHLRDNLRFLKGLDGVVLVEDALQLGTSAGPRLKRSGATDNLDIRTFGDAAYALARAEAGTGANDLTPTNAFKRNIVTPADTTYNSTAFVDLTGASLTLTPPIAGTIFAFATLWADDGGASINTDGRIVIGTSNGVDEPIRDKGALIHNADVTSGATTIKIQVKGSGAGTVNVRKIILMVLFLPTQVSS